MKEKILSSIDVKIILIIFIFTVWGIIQLLILAIFSEMYYMPGTLLFILIIFFSLKSICGEVNVNDCHILLDPITSKKRATFEGFYFKLPWEKVEFTKDLEAEIISKISETFPTTDGSMLVSTSIMSKPDSGFDKNEETRSMKMINYVRYTEGSIKEMQEDWGKAKMRERFAVLTSEEAKSSKHDDLLQIDDFNHIADELSIRIIECPVYDIDYNKTVQDAHDNISKAETLGEMVTALIKTGKYTRAEAKAIAPLLSKDVNLKKQINDVNLNGLTMSPELVTALSSIIKKMGGK